MPPTNGNISAAATTPDNRQQPASLLMVPVAGHPSDIHSGYSQRRSNWGHFAEASRPNAPLVSRFRADLDGLQPAGPMGLPVGHRDGRLGYPLPVGVSHKPALLLINLWRKSTLCRLQCVGPLSHALVGTHEHGCEHWTDGTGRFLRCRFLRKPESRSGEIAGEVPSFYLP